MNLKSAIHLTRHPRRMVSVIGCDRRLSQYIGNSLGFGQSTIPGISVISKNRQFLLYSKVDRSR